MKKQILNFALGTLLLISATNFAQQTIQPCDTYAAIEQIFKQDPQLRINYEALKQNAKELARNNPQYLLEAKAAAATEYTIPVVFHILHTGGPENVSDAQCISALNQVNSDLAKLGSDASTVASPFNNHYIPSDIKLMLAKKDPNGNCTNGIVHRYDTRTVWDRSGGITPAMYSGITWNPTKYLNIIIVKQIVSAPGQQGTVIGYTLKPGTISQGSLMDAIVYNYTFLTGTAPGGGVAARSLSHEFGHWLGLGHTFGETNNPGVVCGNTPSNPFSDDCEDTPDTKGYFTTCPTSMSGNSCSMTYTGTLYTPGQANVENIMDYSSCPKNFTTEQTNIMRGTLDNTGISLPSKGWRVNLVSASNLNVTGVNSTTSCAPIADFYSSVYTYTVCKGGSLVMRDYSYNGIISSYQWAVDNSGVVASPNASSTAITFPVAGSASVTLTVSNAQGSSSLSRVVTVIDNAPGLVGPIVEGFENGILPTNWAISNLNNGSVTWEVTNQSSYEGTYAYYINNYSNQAGHMDALQTPVIDLLNNPGSSLTFRYAYARYTASQNDELIIEGSKDCGGTWQNFFTMSASFMANASGGISTAPFFPQPDQWKIYDLTTHPNWNGSYASSAAVMFRFKYKAAGLGNYIYIDAVNLDVPVGINELTRQTRFNLSPNPSSGAANINFSLDNTAAVGLKVYDVSGRIVENLNLEMNAGEHQLSVNSNSNYHSGIYIVELSVNGARMSKKLVIE